MVYGFVNNSTWTYAAISLSSDENTCDMPSSKRDFFQLKISDIHSHWVKSAPV